MIDIDPFLPSFKCCCRIETKKCPSFCSISLPIGSDILSQSLLDYSRKCISNTKTLPQTKMPGISPLLIFLNLHFVLIRRGGQLVDCVAYICFQVSFCKVESSQQFSSSREDGDIPMSRSSSREDEDTSMSRWFAPPTLSIPLSLLKGHFTNHLWTTFEKFVSKGAVHLTYPHPHPQMMCCCACYWYICAV